MNYEETLNFLFQQLPAYSRIGAAAYKEDIGNIREMCSMIGNPQDSLRCIHVAGTNGKGSVCHMLASILQEAGYKTGLYTSPHIFEFGERIRINGDLVNEQFVINFVEKTKHFFSEIKPSFFEYTVLMAFDYFKEMNVDIAVIETGMGGRLDSTNIITPILSVITSIGFDHTDILGNTLEKIAYEKAGIIKHNVPVVIGEISPETKVVFENKANETNSKIILAEEEYVVEFIDTSGSLLLCNIKNTETGIVKKLRMDLTGIYQTKNARTVLCCISELVKENFNIDTKALLDGLEKVSINTGIRGRWEELSQHPFVIMDVGHNIDGIRAILQQLEVEYPNSAHNLILGFVNDKKIDAILDILPENCNYYFTNAHIERALSHETLREMAMAKGIEGKSYDDVNEALKVAKQNSNPQDVIVVCGSFFVVAEVKKEKE